MQRNLKNEKKTRCRKNVKWIFYFIKALIYFLLKIALCLKQTIKKPNQTPQLKPKVTQQRACIVIRLSESFCRKDHRSGILDRCWEELCSLSCKQFSGLSIVFGFYHEGNWRSTMSYFIHYACLMKYHTLFPRIGAPSPQRSPQRSDCAFTSEMGQWESHLNCILPIF